VLGLWLVLLAVTSGGVVVMYMRCPGCLPRDRVNKTCEWTGDAKFPLESEDQAHREHFIKDAQLAEELAIRYADAEFKRRFGSEAHGGLIDNGRLRGECMSRMFDAIENNHDVTPEQVRFARAQRNRTFDLAVGLLFIPLYSLAATIVCRWLFRRFSSTERFVGVVATGLASVAVSLLGIQCLRLWGAVWEVVRVGNGHMTSIRAASYSRWNQQYVGADFIGGIVLFWLIALICNRVVWDDEHTSDVRGPHGILLR
jgi:hypothetical protein